MQFEVVMGLEVHVELATESKLFCGCNAKFGAGPNQHTCPACIGMPGFPPVLNRAAVEKGMIAAHLTHGVIPPAITFDKKSYFYPDLPTGYQLTQGVAPICTHGWVEIITSDKNSKKISLKQIHIEQDAGKLVHDGANSLVDYNRLGVALIEIVSNPDFRSAEEVTAYLTKLQKLLSFAGVSDCKMQEGSMRCDVNISVRKKGATEYGVRVEIKNMSSLKSIERAIAYEAERHIDLIESGKGDTLIQETRGWDDAKGVTYGMREKVDATDYRYFPDSEIPPCTIDDNWKKSVIDSIPESAENKLNRLVKEFNIGAKEAAILTSNIFIAKIFEDMLAQGLQPKTCANWILTEFLSVLKLEKIDIEEVNINTKQFAHIINLVKEGKLNRNVAKDILTLLVKDNSFDVDTHITQNNLLISIKANELDTIIEELIAQNPKPVAEFKAGNEKVITFFMGQVMKRTSGKADFKTVSELIKSKLK